MKTVLHPSFPRTPADTVSMMTPADDRKPLITRFGEAVDVRNRGALRISRFAGGQMRTSDDAPAVVRLWMAQQCHELSAHEARALAGQLLAASALADQQNGH
jgi:hypothetical protein